MNFHPDVLAAHAEFGGDLESMQKCYEWHDLKEDAAKLRKALRDAHKALMHYEWYANSKSGWASPESETLRASVEAALAGGADA